MFVTTNVAHRVRLFENATYAREAIDAIYRVQALYPFFLFGFVIMPDHVHILLRVMHPSGISGVVRAYKRAVSHAIGIGPIWQPRFYMKIPHNCWRTLEYIHQNPVRAGLSREAEHYAWSSASGKWDVTEME
jgi:putative transposase